MAQVFISHSSKDMYFIPHVKSFFEKLGISAFVAQNESPSGTSLSEKIEKAISQSDALVVFWTKNVVKRQKTAANIGFEVGAAKQTKKDIYMFREEGADVPELVRQNVDFLDYDPKNRDDWQEISMKLNLIAEKLKKKELIRALATGSLIGFAIGSILGLLVGRLDL